MNPVVRLRDADASCGSKAAGLGRLTRAGFAVPDGIVLPDASTGAWQADLPAALAELGGSAFAVRSSAPGEDGPAASFAGQFHTSLNVPRDGVAAAVRRTVDSVGEARAYAAATGVCEVRRMAVIVQRMLDPVAVGVAFTRHPVTGERTTVVEAARDPEDQAPQRWHAREGALTSSGAAVLTAGQAGRVMRAAERVEVLLGGGQDVEWAITPDGRVWLLQARPITTAAGPPGRLPEPAAARGKPVGTPDQPRLPTSPDAECVLARGTPAGPGTAYGPLRVIAGLDDFTRFRPGDVLVCRATSPAWTPLLVRAAAVVTETGGVLAHAAIVARELRIPAVTDVPGAAALPEGAAVRVDGTAGTVTLERP